MDTGRLTISQALSDRRGILAIKRTFDCLGEVMGMAKGGRTSKAVAAKASKVLSSSKSTKTEKAVAASALQQRKK